MGVDLGQELRKTNPDYVVYRPKSPDGSTFDTGNEHFLVFDGPDSSLMVVWTQSTCEGSPNQRIVFSRSTDEGQSWTEPIILAGPTPPQEGSIASWGFPMVSRSGRIYVIYSQHIGKFDISYHTTGLMAGIYSDDAGKSWSRPQVIKMPRSIYDNPDPSMPANWIVWQRPQRLSQGKYFVGFTRWVSSTVRHKPPIDSWIAHESVVEFMRFENIDDDPEPRDIKISYFATNDDALKVGYPEHPELSVVQEPSIVVLPDNRLFVVMRTSTGHPYYSVSQDAGCSWSKPEVLRQYDDGPELLHPLSPCPIYSISRGRYIFLYHNHDGHFEKWGPTDTIYHRRPICLALGEYREGAKQPVWFSAPKFMMDHGGVVLGPAKRCDLAMYASFTIRDNKRILWYPDRKFFLLGKVITDDFIADLQVPDKQGDRHIRTIFGPEIPRGPLNMTDDYCKYIKLGINHHLLFPEVFDDPLLHEQTLPRVIDRTDFEIVDLFIPDDEEIRKREIEYLRESKKEFVYNSPLFPEKDGPNPSSPDPSLRAKAMNAAAAHLNDAASIGARSISMASGRDPGEGERQRAKEAFAEYLIAFCKRAAGLNIDVLIEPFDRSIGKNLLIGPIGEAVDLVKGLREQRIDNLWLLIDMGHLPLMGDSFEDALSLSAPYINHVHLGNCVKSNPSSPHYGDKHPPWGIEGGENDTEEIARFLHIAWKTGYMGEGKRPTMSFEMRPYPDKTEEESIEIFKKKLKEAWKQAFSNGERKSI